MRNILNFYQVLYSWAFIQNLTETDIVSLKQEQLDNNWPFSHSPTRGRQPTYSEGHLSPFLSVKWAPVFPVIHSCWRGSHIL